MQSYSNKSKISNEEYNIHLAQPPTNTKKRLYSLEKLVLISSLLQHMNFTRIHIHSYYCSIFNLFYLELQASL